MLSLSHTYQEFLQVFIVSYNAIVDNSKFCGAHTHLSKQHKNTHNKMLSYRRETALQCAL